jgi:hypothetical protein
MNNLREVAYRIDPVLWVREVLGVEPTKWQENFLRAPRGATILAARSSPLHPHRHRQAQRRQSASLARRHVGPPAGSSGAADQRTVALAMVWMAPAFRLTRRLPRAMVVCATRRHHARPGTCP